MDLRLVLMVKNMTVSTYEGTNASSRYIQFYPSASFAFHIFIPSSFRFLGDILILDISIDAVSTSTFHIHPNLGGKALEGIIRSPDLLFPAEPYNYGGIAARISHARVFRNGDELYPPVEQQREMRLESVVDVTLLDVTSLRVTPITHPSQQALTWKWTFRPLDALREVVSGARLRQGPVWTKEDEVYHKRQLGNVEGSEGATDEYMVRRLNIVEELESDEEEELNDEWGVDGSKRSNGRQTSDNEAAIDQSESSDAGRSGIGLASTDEGD